MGIGCAKRQRIEEQEEKQNERLQVFVVQLPALRVHGHSPRLRIIVKYQVPGTWYELGSWYSDTLKIRFVLLFFLLYFLKVSTWRKFDLNSEPYIITYNSNSNVTSTGGRDKAKQKQTRTYDTINTTVISLRNTASGKMGCHSAPQRCVYLFCSMTPGRMGTAIIVYGQLMDPRSVLDALVTVRVPSRKLRAVLYDEMYYTLLPGTR